MAENPLRVTHFRVQILFPPIAPRFSGTTLQELFLEISQRHHYEKCELIGDQGVLLSTEAIRSCEIRRDRVILSENIQTSLDLVQKDFQDIVGIVKKKLNLNVLIGFQSLMRAVWPLAPTNSAWEFLQSHVFNIKPDQFKLLGVNIAGAGLRISCPEFPKRAHDFKIEPYFRDQRHIFIELESVFPEAIQTDEIFMLRMQDSYKFMMDNIVPFLHSFGLQST